LAARTGKTDVQVRPHPQETTPMAAQADRPRIYDGDGDMLMQQEFADTAERIVLLPDALPSPVPDRTPRIRIMWGQHLLEDLLLGRYHTLVCAVNAHDNRRGIITQLAALLPTSQWDAPAITSYAAHFSAAGERVKVIKYDMDIVEVLAVLRPPTHEHLTIDDLSAAFRIVVEMLRHKPGRMPSASVSFLGAHANRLVDRDGNEPSFETVLRAMHEAGYVGDVYPSPAMWHTATIGLYARYPFAPALEQMRKGGY
jgi:hypothetical protein